MEASRTHEQIQGQPVWLFVAIGVVVLVIAALSLGVGMNTGEDVATYPAGPAVAFDAGAATRIQPRAAEGNHYAGAFAGMRTGPREGGEYAEASIPSKGQEPPVISPQDAQTRALHQRL